MCILRVIKRLLCNTVKRHCCYLSVCLSYLNTGVNIVPSIWQIFRKQSMNIMPAILLHQSLPFFVTFFNQPLDFTGFKIRCIQPHAFSQQLQNREWTISGEAEIYYFILILLWSLFDSKDCCAVCFQWRCCGPYFILSILNDTGKSKIAVFDG